MVHVNGKKVGGNANICKFTAYVSPYFVVSNGGAYTKHIYAASQRIASKLGNEDGFGADPRRVEMAGGKKISDIQKDNIGARFSELGFTYTAPEKEKVEKDSTMDSESEEKLIFFYHPDHLGSTSYVTDADGNIAQHVEYIPYGEVFVEERNSQFSTNFLFNAKELDNETGLYYYGARYLDPTGGMWLSVDPLFEKYAGMSPYNYCMGNPVKMVDPDGEELLPFFSFNYVKETPQNKDWYKMNGKRYNQQVDINAIIYDYVLNMEDMDNVIFFSAHGEPQGFYDSGDHKHEGGENFMKFLKLNSNSYEKLSKNKSLVIVLFSCETGKGENSLGQQVSKISESLVFAPSEIIYLDPDGRHQVENRGKDGHIHGYWNVFYKGELIDQLNGADVDGKKAIQIDKFLQGKSGKAWIKWYTEEWKWIKKMHDKQNEN